MKYTPSADAAIPALPPSPQQQLDNSIVPTSPQPQSCRIDSNALTTRDPTPKAESKPKQTHDSLWRRVHKNTRSILVAFEDERGHEILRDATAIFDTGITKNFVSPAIVEQFRSVFCDGHGERVILEPAGRYISIGRLAGRWTSKINDYRFRFNSTKRFDIAIGSDTLQNEGIVVFAGKGFRTETASYSNADIDKGDEQHKRRREENDARKKALQDKKASPEKPADEKK